MTIAHVCKSPIGTFAFGDSGELIYYELYDRNIDKIVNELKNPVSDGFLSNLKGYETAEDEVATKFLRKSFRELATDLAGFSSDKELNEFLSSLGTDISKSRLEGAIGRDKLLVQANAASEDIMKIENLLNERLYEWYSLHYPELERKNIANLVATHGKRENFPEFEGSLGVQLTKDDEKVMKEYAQTIRNVEQEKKNLEDYIKRLSKEVMPNFSSLIDPMLASKLLAHAGSLEKLSRMPASSIQLMGAEKALFRHLKGKKRKKNKSPKYGFIFTSSWIQSCAEKHRGKAARILSSKLMQAVRIDCYSGRDDSERLLKDLKEEMKKVLK